MTNEVISPYRALWDGFKNKTKVKVKIEKKQAFGEANCHDGCYEKYYFRYLQLEAKSTKNNCRNVDT